MFEKREFVDITVGIPCSLAMGSAESCAARISLGGRSQSYLRQSVRIWAWFIFTIHSNRWTLFVLRAGLKIHHWAADGPELQSCVLWRFSSSVERRAVLGWLLFTAFLNSQLTGPFAGGSSSCCRGSAAVSTATQSLARENRAHLTLRWYLVWILALRFS